MADICSIVEAAIVGRLSSATIGFNSQYAAVQGTYATPDMQIDFTDGSTNFVYGRVPPDLVEESSPFSYPILTVEANRGQMDGPGQRVHFHQFSGIVYAFIEVTVSWAEGAVINFNAWPNAVIDAMYQSMNDPSQGWASSQVLYNGDMNFQKGNILMAGQNWRRQILFPCSFRVLAA